MNGVSRTLPQLGRTEWDLQKQCRKAARISADWSGNLLISHQCLLPMEIERQTERQTDRQTDRQRDRQTDRQTVRQTDRVTKQESQEHNCITDDWIRDH